MHSTDILNGCSWEYSLFKAGNTELSVISITVVHQDFILLNYFLFFISYLFLLLFLLLLLLFLY